MKMTAKISFELTKDGSIMIEVKGHKSAVQAGLLTIIERIADIEEVPMEDYIDEMKAVATFSEMAKDPDAIFSEILNNLLEEDEGLDRHEEMKELFDKMFEGLN